MKYYSFFEQQKNVKGTVLIMGLVMAFFLNIFANLWAAILFVSNKLKTQVPRWLLFINFLFLVAQLYLYFT
jgi:hypothetical protein